TTSSGSQTMIQRPEWQGEQYVSRFQHQSVVDRYHLRSTYPLETFELLNSLLVDKPRAVLDVGCGTGNIARPLANYVARVDAVDRARSESAWRRLDQDPVAARPGRGCRDPASLRPHNRRSEPALDGLGGDPASIRAPADTARCAGNRAHRGESGSLA